MLAMRGHTVSLEDKSHKPGYSVIQEHILTTQEASICEVCDPVWVVTFLSVYSHVSSAL